MFHKYIKYLIYWTASVSLLGILTACTEGKTVENFLGADPKLQPTKEQPEPENPISQERASQPEKDENIDINSQSDEQELNQNLEISNRPENFPKTIPIYPQAKLLEVDPLTTKAKGKTTWRSPDNIEQITSFYQQKFQDNQWEILQTSPSESQEESTLIAIKDDLEIVLFSYPLPTNQANNQADTEFTIEYQPTNNTLEQTAETSPSVEIIQSESNLESAITSEFNDLNETPEQLREYVKDVAALGILTSYKQDGKVSLNKFSPNKPITRRDYARWLVDINNQFYATSSGDKIHLATKSDQAAFKDIGINDPDYKVIQGLAEAGLIPSRLTNDSSKLLFQPNAPLTRESLITWKVPLDLRKTLPQASTETIADSWGFQDVTSIDAQGLRALFADFQNGDQANIRRVLGYTTLFQPKKPVTRAEAAASLWYLGFQGDGINAQEALKLQEEK